MTQNYYYKHETQNGLVYIHCKWLNDVSLEADPTQVICEISLSDTAAFWCTKVTMEDILRFRSLHIDMELWKQLIQAALVGKSEFRGEPLERRLDFTLVKCTISWISRLEGSIDLQIAEVTLERSPDEETPNRWRYLLNDLFNDEKSLKDSKEAMMTRIKGLEEMCEQLKIAAERIVRGKLDAELLLMDKFKLILNAKKRKIKNLTTALQNADLLHTSASEVGSSSTSPAIASTSAPISNTPIAATSKGKSKRKRTQSQENARDGSSMSQTPSQATPKKIPKKRKRSLSRTPSLEELMADSPLKPSLQSDHIDKADLSPKSFHVSNDSNPSYSSPSLKAISTSDKNLPAVQEEESSSITKVENDGEVASLLDDDEFVLRPRAVRTPRKHKR
ncbi:hypothetical protein BGW37DRAFT_489187 [Umbelopsis sp. PMI_123]|nr:hypothetical protein BGW37DRAFT_489187 [Umbelopsis sp. PMI_123]